MRISPPKFQPRGDPVRPSCLRPRKKTVVELKGDLGRCWRQGPLQRGHGGAPEQKKSNLRPCCSLVEYKEDMAHCGSLVEW